MLSAPRRIGAYPCVHIILCTSFPTGLTLHVHPRGLLPHSRHDCGLFEKSAMCAIQECCTPYITCTDIAICKKMWSKKQNALRHRRENELIRRRQWPRENEMEHCRRECKAL